MKLLLLSAVVIQKSFGCQGFNTAYSGSHTCLGQDLKCHDVSCILYMCTTTEFDRKITHTYNTYNVTVFFSEQGSSSCLLRFFDRHIFDHNRKILPDLLVHDIFHFLQFFCCHGREVCKVKTQSLCIVQRPCLFYMISEYHAKSFLKQMRCTVIVLSQCTILFVNFQHYLVTDFDHTFCNLSDMAEFITCKLHNIFHYKFAVFCTDHAFISFLSTHRRIERSLSSNDRSFISVCQCIYHFCLTCHSCYFRFHFQLVISNKFRR